MTQAALKPVVRLGATVELRGGRTWTRAALWGVRGAGRLSSDGSGVDTNQAFFLLAGVFILGAVVFLAYSWWNRDRPISLTAWQLSVFFWFAGIAILVLWRVTGGRPDR